MLPPRLEADLSALSAGGWMFSLYEESGFISVILNNMPTTPLFYNQPTTDILVRVPRMYPEAGPDMFWTEPDLLLVDGRIPANADVLEHYCGRQWRRFSWHRQAAWNPAMDWLGTHVELVRQRLEGP